MHDAKCAQRSTAWNACTAQLLAAVGCGAPATHPPDIPPCPVLCPPQLQVGESQVTAETSTAKTSATSESRTTATGGAVTATGGAATDPSASHGVHSGGWSGSVHALHGGRVVPRRMHAKPGGKACLQHGTPVSCRLDACFLDCLSPHFRALPLLFPALAGTSSADIFKAGQDVGETPDRVGGQAGKGSPQGSGTAV